jgi:integrase
MARKAEATLWMLVKIGERSVLKGIVKKGRSYVPNVNGPYELGSYYLRYTQNGKRIWETVSNDLTLALQEQRARQRALETPAVPVAVTALPKRNLRDVVAEFLNGKDNKNWCYILTVFGDWWDWEKHVENFQRPDFKAFAKHVASLSLRPRTEDNYLRNVCTFFRAAGRVVEIVRNEQKATLAARKTTIPNTLFLVSRDFPTVNKGMADYYSDAQIEGLFAGAIKLGERLMLSMFYYTGMREAEVFHLYWSKVNWEAEEIEVKEKPEWDWTSKSSVVRIIEAPPQLMALLREAYRVRGTSKLIFPNQLNHPEGHFLDAIQKIAYRAKITCGERPNCMEHKGRNGYEFGLHKFRYTYGRMLDRGKTPLKDIKLAFGHRDINTTDGYLGGGDTGSADLTGQLSEYRLPQHQAGSGFCFPYLPGTPFLLSHAAGR